MYGLHEGRGSSLPSTPLDARLLVYIVRRQKLLCDEYALTWRVADSLEIEHMINYFKTEYKLTYIKD